MHIKSADLELLIHNSRPSHCLKGQINNRKPTPIWQTALPKNGKAGYNCHTHRHLLLTLILTLNDEICEVSNCQMQSVNKRYQYV